MQLLMQPNSSLLGGGGVDGAIHKAGGEEILNECRAIRKYTFIDGLPTGKAIITTAGNLKAKVVIHTVGPIWNGGNDNEDSLLAECYCRSLNLLIKNNLKTIAFPAISTGVYGYPKDRAAFLVAQTIQHYLELCNNFYDIKENTTCLF